MLSRFSHVQLCATPWTVACQAHLSMDENIGDDLNRHRKVPERVHPQAREAAEGATFLQVESCACFTCACAGAQV